MKIICSTLIFNSHSTSRTKNVIKVFACLRKTSKRATSSNLLTLYCGKEQSPSTFQTVAFLSLTNWRKLVYDSLISAIVWKNLKVKIFTTKNQPWCIWPKHKLKLINITPRLSCICTFLNMSLFDVPLNIIPLMERWAYLLGALQMKGSLFVCEVQV